MIDIKLLRANPDEYRQAARAKNISCDLDALLKVDRRLLDAQRELQDIKTAQNKAGKEIAQLQGPAKQAAIAQMAELKKRAKELSDTVTELEPKFQELMLLVPQPADPEVPLGRDDTENVELRRVGEVRKFDFTPKDHIELGTALDIIDVDRGVKLAGSRNYVLKGAGALMHQAILRLALDQMVAKGYTLMTVPVLVNESVMEGTGYFPVGRDQAYLCERDAQALVGTAEVPVTAYHCGEILAEADLPRKYVALSTCFRREAGAAGKDTYGLYRIHYFDKVEQVILGPNDVTASKAFHQEILRNSEDVLNAMGLLYAVVNVC
ncbi:MAG TPA: serine--tRNA ligase, partial [Phycisphaerae bacterium]|nr:serine--tRNA ligase [Phycisphaerae bacterium]